MWECLTKALCQKSYQKTHVWNLENRRHLTVPTRPKKGNGSGMVDLDWNRGRRMDSYFLEGTTQTVVRQEVYKKICLMRKSPLYSKDVFSVSMRNVNERIINERNMTVPPYTGARKEALNKSVSSTSETRDDMDTTMTDVEEDDSIENVSVRPEREDVCRDCGGLARTSR